MIRSKKRKGFTLIEVALAIVIGVIMIAGATLIYNQAKTSAGNSRAEEKVIGLQQSVEAYAAQNAGSYPGNLNVIGDLWQTARPADNTTSPWGGPVGSAVSTGGVIGDQGLAPDFALTFVTTGAPTLIASSSPTVQTTGVPTAIGLLVYDLTTQTTAVGEINSPLVNVNHYGIYIMDSNGRGPNFVVGGQ